MRPQRCEKESNNKNQGLKQVAVMGPGEIMQELEEEGIFLRGRYLQPIANCCNVLKEFGTGPYREISLKTGSLLLECPAVQILLPYTHLHQQKKQLMTMWRQESLNLAGQLHFAIPGTSTPTSLFLLQRKAFLFLSQASKALWSSRHQPGKLRNIKGTFPYQWKFFASETLNS